MRRYQNTSEHCPSLAANPQHCLKTWSRKEKINDWKDSSLHNMKENKVIETIETSVKSI